MTKFKFPCSTRVSIGHSYLIQMLAEDGMFSEGSSTKLYFMGAMYFFTYIVLYYVIRVLNVENPMEFTQKL